MKAAIQTNNPLQDVFATEENAKNAYRLTTKSIFDFIDFFEGSDMSRLRLAELIRENMPQ